MWVRIDRALRENVETCSSWDAAVLVLSLIHIYADDGTRTADDAEGTAHDEAGVDAAATGVGHRRERHRRQARQAG